MNNRRSAVKLRLHSCVGNQGLITDEELTFGWTAQNQQNLFQREYKIFLVKMRVKTVLIRFNVFSDSMKLLQCSWRWRQIVWESILLVFWQGIFPICFSWLCAVHSKVHYSLFSPWVPGISFICIVCVRVCNTFVHGLHCRYIIIHWGIILHDGYQIELPMHIDRESS